MQTIHERRRVGTAVIAAISLLGLTAASASAAPLDTAMKPVAGGTAAVQGAVDSVNKTAAPPAVTKSTPVLPDVSKAAPPPPNVTKTVPRVPDVSKSVPPPPDVTKAVPPPPNLIKVVPSPLDVAKSLPPPPDVTKAVQPPPDVAKSLPLLPGAGLPPGGPPALPPADLGKTVERVSQVVDTGLGGVGQTLQSSAPAVVLPPSDPPGTAGGPPAVAGVLHAAAPLLPVPSPSPAPLSRISVQIPQLVRASVVPSQAAGAPANSTPMITPLAVAPVPAGAHRQPAGVHSATVDSPNTPALSAAGSATQAASPSGAYARGSSAAAAAAQTSSVPRRPQDPRAPGLPGLGSGFASGGISLALVIALAALLAWPARRWSLFRLLDPASRRPTRFVFLLERPG